MADVRTAEVHARRRFADADEVWQPFLGGQGAAGGYLATLDPELAAAIGTQFRRRLPTQADGTLDLTARAWTVRGTRPG